MTRSCSWTGLGRRGMASCPRLGNVIIHEIAHQWFGNSVTESDWDDVWLSEGYAAYFTSLFIEHAYGHDEFIETIKRSRDSVRAFDAKTPNDRLVHDNSADMSRVTTFFNGPSPGIWT